jgi:hypothetical protein
VERGSPTDQSARSAYSHITFQLLELIMQVNPRNNFLGAENYTYGDNFENMSKNFQVMELYITKNVAQTDTVSCIIIHL